MRYRGLLAYDGSHFHGFQDQPDRRTVQGETEAALSALSGSRVTLLAAGRTDAGVHAVALPVMFSLPDPVPPEGVLANLARRLPHDILLYQLGEAPDGFHPRFSALAKTYRYVISFSRPDPFLVNYLAYDDYRASSMDAFCEALSYFEGTHDFTSFTKNHEAIDAVRTISRLSVERHERKVVLEVTSAGFLHNEIRIMVGSATAVARGRITLEDLPEIERSRTREGAPFLAPASGLYLLSVSYPDGYGPDDAASAQTDSDPSRFLFRLSE